MKKYFIPLLFLIFTVIVIIKLDYTTDYIADILEDNPQIQTLPINEYTKEYDFNYVKLDNDFIPLSYKDIINIYFNVLNNGWDTFTFYCPSEYIDCYTDIKEISENRTLLSNINNFTHPFNNFKTIKTSMGESGEMIIKITKLYTEEEINKINNMVDELANNLLKGESTSTEDTIKNIHDYIINNTKYDELRNKTGESPYASNTAIGVLESGYGICSGYADLMAIFLSRLGLKNFKVASKAHVWNAVFLGGEWLNLDLTWDDPVSTDGRDTLWHKYFLIKTEKFSELDKPEEEDHIFDLRVYSELR